MLTFATDTCIEAADADIEALYRSTSPARIVADAAVYELQAYLCHLRRGETLLQVAFLCRELKRTLVFAVGPTDAAPAARRERVLELLQQLGFRMDAVNLQLSSAMRQVVLRDIPVLQPPGASARQRAERTALLEELERSSRSGAGDEAVLGDTSLPITERLKLKQAIESRREAAKTAAHRLLAERRLEEQALLLRRALEKRLAAGDSIVPAAAASAAPLKPTPPATGPQKVPAKPPARPEKAKKEKPRKTAPVTEPKATPPPAGRNGVVEAEAAARRDDGGSAPQLEGLSRQLDQARARAAAAESERERLADLLAATQTRTRELEEALEQAEAAATRARNDRSLASKAEQRARELAASLEQAESRTRAADDESARQAAELKAATARLEELTHELEAVRQSSTRRIADLERELAAARTSAASIRAEVAQRDALAQSLKQAEQKAARLERELAAARKTTAATGDKLQAAAPAKVPDLPPEPAPEVIRRPPAPGAFFHVDWDLERIPCSSGQQVSEAWQSIYNVQLSLEGYPSQYCSAFLIVLSGAGKKQLFMPFRLNTSKRTLIYRPARPPENAAAFAQALAEAQTFLKRSGIELEKIPPAETARTLVSVLAPT